MGIRPINSPYLPDSVGRILVITGHYGSGKTEYAVSLAMLLAAREGFPYPRIALIDADIVNPYFRSRERADMLAARGVRVYGSFYGHDVTAEIPELAANIRAPLDDGDCFTIIDAGGNDSGARVLHQIEAYFTRGEHTLFSVINKNRPETATLAGAAEHISAIERETGLTVDGLVSNTHLLTETTAREVLEGHAFCTELSRITGKPLITDAYPEKYVSPDELSSIAGSKTPLSMYMRATWLDK